MARISQQLLVLTLVGAISISATILAATADGQADQAAQASAAPNSAQDAEKTDAGNPEKAASKTGSNSKQRRMPGVTAGREAAVMAFVQQHHPQLTELLLYLKRNRPKEYQLAVRDLFRTSERLAQIQERDFERYELEAALWKAGSRVQLLAAQLQMSQDEHVYSELRDALNEQIDIRLQLLQRDRDRQADRLKKLDEQLERIATRRTQTVERQLRKFTSEASRSSAAEATEMPANKNAAGKGAAPQPAKTSPAKNPAAGVTKEPT